jgi:hypothetical protein
MKNMQYRYLFLLVYITLFTVASSLFGQITITNSSFNSFNVTPNSLCRITLLNGSGITGEAYLEAEVRNAANDRLIAVQSNVFTIKPGINTILPSTISFASIAYSGSNQAEFLRVQNKLPSGVFTYCVRVVPIGQIEEGDEYCESLDGNEDALLYLVYPLHEEVIETPQPVLMWMHSEPFNLLAPGEYFRLNVVELFDGQSADAGIGTNQAIFSKNYINSHQVPYPQDAKLLEPGKRYGWVVQKISNGNIVARTEAWEFSLSKTGNDKRNVYVLLKKQLDGSVYVPQNDRLYFRFDERYVSGQLDCTIRNEKRELIVPEIKSENGNADNTKTSGANMYELDLQPYKLKNGYYVLEVVNEKNEKYLLKFIIEK